MWRLTQLFVIESPGFDAAVQIVADIFWLNEIRVTADVRSARRSISIPLASRPRYLAVPS